MRDYIDITVPRCSVMIGIPAGRNPSWQTVTALLGTFADCQNVGVHVELRAITGCSIVTKARDEVLDTFLNTTCDYLFWIDDDIEWSPDQFLRILALSSRYGVVGVSYPAKVDKQATFYVKMRDLSDPEYGEAGLIDAEGMGLGFCCMPRDIVAEVAASKPRMIDNHGRNMASVFRTDIHEGRFRGEDIAFFADIRAAGHKVWIDPSVELGHVGPKRFTGKLADALTQPPEPISV